MATRNAINTEYPVDVPNGGTGAASLTDHGILIGSGASSITAASVGTTGQLCVGTSAADASFSSSADEDFTFLSSTASQNRILTISNTDNTGAATSQATMQITVGGANVGDPKVTHTVTGAASFTTGIDNSDSDKYKISASTALGTTDVFRMTTAGERTLPLQAAFLAYKSSTSSNVTGAGTGVSYVCDTEAFDQNGDYNNGTGVFTAPVSGRYFFCMHAYLDGCTIATNTLHQIQTSNRLFYELWERTASNLFFPNHIGVYADMDAADTAYPIVNISGEAGDTVDLVGHATVRYTTFSGFLDS